MPLTTLLEIPPAEQVQMRAVLRRTRYGSLLAFHIFLLCAAGRNPTEIAACLCRAISQTLSCVKARGGVASLLAVPGLIACTAVRLFDTSSCPWTPPSTFSKLLSIERAPFPHTQ